MPILNRTKDEVPACPPLEMVEAFVALSETKALRLWRRRGIHQVFHRFAWQSRPQSWQRQLSKNHQDKPQAIS